MRPRPIGFLALDSFRNLVPSQREEIRFRSVSGSDRCVGDEALLGVVVVITLPLIGNVMIGGGVGALIGLVLALIVGKIGLAAMGTAFSPPMLAIVLLFSLIAAIGAFFGGFGIARILLWPAALPLLVLGLWFLLRRKPREDPIEIEASVPVTKEPA